MDSWMYSELNRLFNSSDDEARNGARASRPSGFQRSPHSQLHSSSSGSTSSSGAFSDSIFRRQDTPRSPRNIPILGRSTFEESFTVSSPKSQEYLHMSPNLPLSPIRPHSSSFSSNIYYQPSLSTLSESGIEDSPMCRDRFFDDNGNYENNQFYRNQPFQSENQPFFMENQQLQSPRYLHGQDMYRPVESQSLFYDNCQSYGEAGTSNAQQVAKNTFLNARISKCATKQVRANLNQFQARPDINNSRQQHVMESQQRSNSENLYSHFSASEKYPDTFFNQRASTSQNTLRWNHNATVRPPTPQISRDVSPVSSTKGMCSFCRKNGETAVVYTSHPLKTKVGKKSVVMCPILRCHVCVTCGATGDNAHTFSYCPVLRSYNKGMPLESTTVTLKNTRVKSNGRRRF